MIDLPPLTRADLIAMGQRIHIPRPLEASEPTPGQVWRALWDDTVSLVVVLDPSPTSMLVAPLFLDFDRETFEDDESTDFVGRRALVLWYHARKIAPLTLDALFGVVALNESAPIRPVEDADLESMLEPLNKLAVWAKEGEGDGTLRERLRNSGATASSVAAALDVPLAVAAQVIRGTRPVTPKEAEALATTTSLTADTILASNPALPDNWHAELQASEYRAPIRSLAQLRQKSDSEAWRSAAYGAYALAARQANSREDASVRARIHSYLQSELATND